MNHYNIILTVFCCAFHYSNASLQRRSVDLSNPIDVAAPLIEPRKSVTVHRQNRKEARLPFFDPRSKPFDHLKDSISSNVDFNRNELKAVKSTKIIDDINRRDDASSDPYKPVSQPLLSRRELQRRRETELQINDALRKRDKLLYSSHGPSLAISSASNNYNSYNDFGSDPYFDRTISANIEINSGGRREKLYRSNDKQSSTRDKSNSDGGSVDEKNKYNYGSNYGYSGKRKPPILIIEKVPVYHVVEKPVKSDDATDKIKDYDSNPNYIEDQSDAYLDRRPNRTPYENKDNVASPHTDQFSNKYGHANGQYDYDERYDPPLYDDLPQHNLPPVPQLWDEPEYSQIPVAPPPDYLVQGEPIPYFVHDAIRNEEKLELQRRLHAQALALGAIQQRAVAGLALQHQLNQLASLQKLKHQQATEDNEEVKSYGKDHQPLIDQDLSATRELHSLDNDDDNSIHDEQIKKLITAEVRDTIRNQIEKHLEDIISTKKFNGHVNREEIIKHILMLRPELEHGYEEPTQESVTRGSEYFAPEVIDEKFEPNFEAPVEDFYNHELKFTSQRDQEFLNFVENMPDSYFHEMVHMPKGEFLRVMFPRLYRDQVTTTSTPSPPDPHYQLPLSTVRPDDASLQHGFSSYSTPTPTKIAQRNKVSGDSSVRDVGFRGVLTNTPQPQIFHRGTPSRSSFKPSIRDRHDEVYTTVAPTKIMPLKSSSDETFIPMIFESSNSDINRYDVQSPKNSNGLSNIDDTVKYNSPHYLQNESPQHSTVHTIPEKMYFDSVQESTRPSIRSTSNTQPQYSTISPTIFHSTISHPKLTTSKPRFTAYSEPSSIQTAGSDSDVPIIIVTPESVGDNSDEVIKEIFLNERESDSPQSGTRPPYRTPQPLIGGFEGSLRPIFASEKLEDLNKERTAVVNSLKSTPGTDDSDDRHTLTPFQRRQGNSTATEETTDINPIEDSANVASVKYQEVPSVIHFASPTTPSGSQSVIGASPVLVTTSSTEEPNATTEETHADQTNEKFRDSPSVNSATIFSQRTISSPRSPAGHLPIPQRVDVRADSVNIIPSTGMPASAMSTSVTQEEITAQMPDYLRVAPPCAGPAHSLKSFCLADQNYPSEAAQKLTTSYKQEINELSDILNSIETPQVDLNEARHQIPGLDSSVTCEMENRTVVLGWMRDVIGNWFTLLQSDSFEQPITVQTCSAIARSKGCRPLLLPRPLIAFHYQDPEPRPLVGNFAVPIACVYSS